MSKMKECAARGQRGKEVGMINRLIAKIRETNAPIVAGLDPMMKFVPEHIRKAAFHELGETLEGAGKPSGASTRASWMPSGTWCPQ